MRAHQGETNTDSISHDTRIAICAQEHSKAMLPRRGTSPSVMVGRTPVTFVSAHSASRCSDVVCPALYVKDLENDVHSLEEHLTLNSADRASLLFRAAECVKHVHEVHREIYGDIKLGNILVSANGSVRLRHSVKTTTITSEPRESNYPNEKLPMTTATDVYAFAWLIFHVYTDIDPQELALNSEILRLIAAGAKPTRPGPATIPAKRGLDDAIWELCLCCWEISPAARPLMAEVMRVLEIAIGKSAM
ncbi:hypothetical protein EXIGLDRAFT_717045 [Exidia glandulosa HHB12029]|uniref:Serine-threonine/tyrosine-protein kinase catalytic domain-containing protein n=1 Tax=Exidia glandulosa HHB12029 TaxID=1314781 RepID=A0A165ILP5_EXIGL|nr:hypothetical protein EXIGLDRAFT_717045 [Exidia glandulosa HHB12029]